MKTVETDNQGLKRAFMLTIPAADIDKRVDQEVKRIAPQVKMPGFRPGKVPANLIRKMHGESIHGDALNTAVQEGVQQLMAEQKIRPAMQPQVELTEGYEPGKDAEVRVQLEALPDVPAPLIEGLKLERLTVKPDEAAVDEQVERLLQANKAWVDAPSSKVAATGDLVVMDFLGKVDGKPFEGGKGDDMQVEIGSGQLIPGFEDGLVGAKAGDNREVDVTFPGDYPAEDLKGKAAVFDVTVKAVKVAGKAKADDAFAKTLGLEDLEQLRTILRQQQEQELNGLTRTHMKRRLLDQLAVDHDFPVPETMVEAEYQNIMNQLRHEASHEVDSEAALAEIEKEADDYRSISVRRVRLGLLLSEIGQANGVEVSQQEMNRLIAQAAQQYPQKDRERFVQYIQQEPMAGAQLRAPLYEDKVVDFLFSKAEITDREVSRAEVEADLESEEGHVHGPNCGHDHGAAPAAKGKAKTKKTKNEVAASEGPTSAGAKTSSKLPKASKGAPAPAKVKLTEDATTKLKPAKPKKSEPANKPVPSKDDGAAAAKVAGDGGAKKAPAKKAK
ncbi:MAG: trigger factor [Pseudomonadota bacterium]|nr:trigger factor [Pseudomonadota bacterium]